jgi:hypothetical protein
MVDILDDEFYVCTDCIMVIANGDTSSLDYYYGEKADEREAEINEGVEGVIVPGNSDLDLEFSSRGCDCCRSRLAGSLHHCVVLSA